jgi:hypothetical protein
MSAELLQQDSALRRVCERDVTAECPITHAVACSQLWGVCKMNMEKVEPWTIELR